MNERIKELMVQVCKEQGLPFTVEHNRAYMLDNFSEKFAELIVRECANVFWSEDCNTSDLALEEYNRNSKKIKQHFGVEE